ncbi:MAG TPA: hypothetical protein VK552_23030, partial [Reyranella sp.]|nr:hypothetical protein [Reyranella sp.]
MPIVTPHTSWPQGQFPPIRLYSIEFKDDETADTAIFTADDWTEDEKRLALALIGRLNRLYAARRSQVSADVESRQGRADTTERQIRSGSG